jgi:hypothetical protein
MAVTLAAEGSGGTARPMPRNSQQQQQQVMLVVTLQLVL